MFRLRRECRAMARSTRVLLGWLYDAVPLDVRADFARDYAASRRYLRDLEHDSDDLYDQDEEEK